MTTRPNLARKNPLFVVTASFVWILTGSPAEAQVTTKHTTAAMKAATPAANATTIKDGYYAQGDMPAITYRGSTSSCSLNGGNGDDGFQIKSTGGGCWTASPPVGGWPLAMWGAVGDVTTDDTAAIVNALAVCHSDGGGRILLGYNGSSWIVG